MSDHSPSELALMASGSGVGLLGYAENRYGTPTAVYRCPACGDAFTVCPAVGEDQWGTGCMGDLCSTYDPDRDVEMLMLRGAKMVRDDEEPK